MKSLCERCKDKSCYGYDRRKTECEDFQAMTNADKIRAMTDEELADWLVLVEMRIRQLQPMLEIPALKKDWLDWLQQEADNG